MGIEQAQRFLASVQDQNGGWPYRKEKQSSPEPTCLSLLALSSIPTGGSGSGFNSRIDRGLQWIESCAGPDGAVRLEGDDEPHWSTSLFLLTLARLRPTDMLKERSARYLLSWAGEQMGSREKVALNARLKGWPWVSGSFSWVEPTSYAVLALKMSGYGRHPRVEEAERLLRDRACIGGGWNYGNRTVYGRDLPPYATTTALAALALQDSPTAAPIIRDSLALLRTLLHSSQSAFSLALSILCFTAFDEPVSAFVEALGRRQEPDGSWRSSVHLTALATLALQSGTGGFNVFRL